MLSNTDDRPPRTGKLSAQANGLIQPSEHGNVPMTPRLLIAALGLLCFALPARADGEVQKIITPADKVRLDKYGETRKAALAEAKAGDPAEVSQLDALLAKPLV